MKSRASSERDYFGPAALAQGLNIDRDEAGLWSIKNSDVWLQASKIVWDLSAVNGSAASYTASHSKATGRFHGQESERRRCQRCPRDCKETKPLVGADGEKNFYSNGATAAPAARAISAERTGGGKSKPKTAPKVVCESALRSHQHRVGGGSARAAAWSSISFQFGSSDHAGVDHDLVLNFDTVKQLMTELLTATR